MKKFVTALLIVALLATGALSLAEQKTYKIGIAQFAVHGSLDNCAEGFIQGLKENGFEEGVNITLETLNAQADMGMATQIANQFVDNGYDLICAIATPMAVVSHKAADDKIPVIYTAVSSPIKAELATAEGKGIGNVTGTSDELPVKQQLQTIRAMQPDAKVIGILYTLSETNSVVQVEEYQRQAPEHGFTVEALGVATGADIALALPTLLSKVDLVTMVLDNTVVQYLDTVLEAAEPKQIPVYGSEIEQVKRGCVAAEGLDYIALGRQTGALAARVLKGEAAGDIPFETIKESSLYYNTAACEAMGIKLSDDLMARGTKVDE
ncbi:MAG: ABC transporter substrate-binding protein [Clostridiales bacterium]|nr:ABC transporter substrate-binding protein [Clostridiales bacterium]